MSDFQQYRRTQLAELRPYVPGEDLSRVSIAAVDRENGSPKPGDMIARNPANHADQWLVAADYFRDNFAPMGDEQDALKRLEHTVSCQIDAINELQATLSQVLRLVTAAYKEGWKHGMQSSPITGHAAVSWGRSRSKVELERLVGPDPSTAIHADQRLVAADYFRANFEPLP